MSADSWSTCPKCEDKRIQKFKKALDAVESLYGKVSSEVYLKKLKEVQKSKKLVTDSNEESITLREDYEIYLTGNKLSIDYSASCDVCRFSYNFTHKEQIYTPENK